MKAADPVTTPPAAPAAPTLAYGRSRRSYRREVKIALFVLPTLALAWWALPRVPSRLKFLSQQSVLMRLTRTAGTAVWDETEAKVTSIESSGSGGGYALRVIGGQPGVTTAACLYDPSRRAFDAAIGAAPNLDFTAFAHAQTAADGKSRLVVVDGYVSSFLPSVHHEESLGRIVWLNTRLIEPGTFFRPPTVLSTATAMSIELHPEDRFRLFAGEFDPADPTRIKIDYDCNGIRGTVHGIIAADGSIALTATGDVVGTVASNGPIIHPAGTKAPRPTTSPAQ